MRSPGVGCDLGFIVVVAKFHDIKGEHGMHGPHPSKQDDTCDSVPCYSDAS